MALRPPGGWAVARIGAGTPRRTRDFDGRGREGREMVQPAFPPPAPEIVCPAGPCHSPGQLHPKDPPCATRDARYPCPWSSPRNSRTPFPRQFQLRPLRLAVQDVPENPARDSRFPCIAPLPRATRQVAHAKPPNRAPRPPAAHAASGAAAPSAKARSAPQSAR
jgi:hypothetical protein